MPKARRGMIALLTAPVLALVGVVFLNVSRSGLLFGEGSKGDKTEQPSATPETTTPEFILKDNNGVDQKLALLDVTINDAKETVIGFEIKNVCDLENAHGFLVPYDKVQDFNNTPELRIVIDGKHYPAGATSKPLIQNESGKPVSFFIGVTIDNPELLKKASEAIKNGKIVYLAIGGITKIELEESGSVELRRYESASAKLVSVYLVGEGMETCRER